MKKFALLFTLVAALSMPFQPRKAEGALIFGLIDPYITGPEVALIVIACIITLPLCILDEDQPQSTQAVSARYLLDNGYSQAEVDTIIADQKTLSDRLAERKQGMALEPNETQASYAKTVQQVYPEVSDEYLNFTAEYLGLR